MNTYQINIQINYNKHDLIKRSYTLILIAPLPLFSFYLDILTSIEYVLLFVNKNIQLYFKNYFLFHLNQAMASFNEASRMSKIQDHNMYQETDNLYEPLRNAFRKSTVSQKHFLGSTMMLDNNLSTSRVTKNMRSFSPAEVESIKRNLFIPVNKQLIPTRNTMKVRDKKFTAINMEQKVHEALTPQQFSRVKPPIVEEVVYELYDNVESNRNIYTSKNINISPHVKINSLQTPNFYQSRFITESRINKMNSPTNIYLNNQPNIPRPMFVSHSNKDLIQIDKTLVNNNSKQIFENTSAFSSSQNLNGKHETKSYDFKQSNAESQRLSLKSRKMQSQYKYNLFSIIDEAGNTGCRNGCFASNQIIASKMTDERHWV